MSRLFFFVLCFWYSGSNAISPEKCINQNQKCELDGNNLIQSVALVTGPECQQLCEDTMDCNVFTYFGEGPFPYQHLCELFISCDTLDECEDCVTVNEKSDCSCGISFEGSVNSDNIVHIEEDVQTEQDCRGICSSISSCSVYTYYEDGHETVPRLCLLLSALQDPVQSCENCQTGSATCAAFEECRVGVWDDGYAFSMAKKLLTTESKTLRYVSGESGCYIALTAVAVGSGAEGGWGCGSFPGGHWGGGGGGSGYINATGIILPANTNVLVEIERTGAGTVLTRQDTEDILLSAGNGKPGTNSYCDGGAGYSGGGGAYGYGDGIGGDGGSDGQNGVKGYFPGGKGSGFDITSIVMQYYKLSSGKEGTHKGQYGGGAAGVLVDGSGPETGNIAGVGEGYGGGGGGSAVSGSHGCVILEF